VSASQTGGTTLTVIDVHRTFHLPHRREVQALRGIDVIVESGVRTGVVGESGSGKSTLARLLLGLDHPTTGLVLWNGISVRSLRGRELRRFRKEVQMIGQDTSSSFDPLRSLRDSVRRPAYELLGMSTREADVEIDRILASLSLDARMADRRPHEVSGGQRQRFAIARAMIVKPAIIVCDESVSALDVSVQGAVLNEIKQYCETTGAGLVFVSHGLPATAFISEDLVVMNDGRIVERGPTTDVMSDPQDAYTKTLIDAYRALSGEVAA
jgi:peptide/nickel transport system ATP-binding protein